MDEKRPASASERSAHKLKTELKTGDSGVPKTQTLSLEPERSVTKMHKLGGSGLLKPLLGAWDKGGMGIDLKSDSSTMMISGKASPIGSRHSLENLGKLNKKGLALQGDRMQTSKHKLAQESLRGIDARGIDDLVVKLSDYAVQAQREATAQGEDKRREADEEGLQRLAASKEKLQKFILSSAPLKTAGTRSKDGPDSSFHSLQSKSKGILVMGMQLMDGSEATNLPLDGFTPRAIEEPISSDQKLTKKQYGSQESDTQHQKYVVSIGDQTKAIKGATTSGTTGPDLDDKRQRQVKEEDSSKWKSKQFNEEKRMQIAPSGKGDDGQMGTNKDGDKDGLADTSDGDTKSPTAETAKDTAPKDSKGSKGSRRFGPKESGGPDADKQGKRKAKGKKESKVAIEKPQKPDDGEDKQRTGKQKEPKSTTAITEGDENRGKEESEGKTQEALHGPAEPMELAEKARPAVRRVSPRERRWKEFIKPEKPEPVPEPPPAPQPEEPPVVAEAPKVEPEAAPEEPVHEQPPEELDEEEHPDEPPPVEAPVEPIASPPERKETVKPSAPLFIKRPTHIYKEHHFEFTRPFVFSYFRTKPCHYNPENQQPVKADTMDRAQARLLNQYRTAPDKLRDEGERRKALELHTLDERVRSMQSSPDHIKARLELLTRLLSRA